MQRAKTRKPNQQRTNARPASAGFPTKPGNRRGFLASKAHALKQLNEALKRPSRSIGSLAPMLSNCLVKLNRLDFAYSWDSNRPLFHSGEYHLSRTLPKGKKRFYYIAPFISIRLDSSARSFQFWQRISDLVKRYPKACLAPSEPNPGFEIEPSAGRPGTMGELISKEQLKSKFAEARKFFKEFEQIVDEFLPKQR